MPDAASTALPAPRTATGGRNVVPLLYAGYLLSFIDRIIFSIVMKPAKAALGFTDAQLGLLAGAAFAVTYAVFSPLGGWLVDRVDRRRLMAGAIAFWSCATFLSGLASSFLAFAVLRAAVGVGEAVFNPLAFSLISDAIPRGRRAGVFGLYLSAGALGTITAYLFGSVALRLLAGPSGAYGAASVLVPVLGELAPWRCVFLLAALPGLLLAGVVLLKLGVPSRETATGDGFSEDRVAAFLRRHWCLLSGMSLGLAVAQLGPFTALTWNVVFFQRVHGWDLSRAAAVLGLAGGAAALLGCIAGGPIINAVRRRGYADAPLRVGLAASIIYTVLATVGFLAPSPALAVAALTLASFWGYMPSVAIYAAMADVLPAGARGRFAGFNTLVIGIVTNSIGPFAVGFLNDHAFPHVDGIRLSLVTTLAATMLLAALLIVPALHLYRRRMAETRPNVHAAQRT